MRRLFVVAFVLVLMPLTALADDWQASSPEAEGMSSRELADLVTFGISNGMDSLLVVRHGHIVAEAYYAPFAVGFMHSANQPVTATEGIKHRINSSTKSVVSTLTGMAFKEGLLKSTDQKVLDFFPDRQFAKMDERKNAITVGNLLDMTSGLDWNEPLGNATPWSLLEMERSPDWVQYVLDHGMARQPGASFDYNSGAVHVLSAILTKVTGKSALDYAREKLFKPLGIEDVFWRGDPQGVSGGGAGLYLEPRDMAKLGQFWLQDGVWHGKRLLPDGWIERAHHGVVDMPFPGLRYGNLFWSIPSRDVFSAVGFHRQLIMVFPALDMVAVFTGSKRYSNAEGKPSSPDYSLSVMADRLKATVKSQSALPEDPEGRALLADKIREAATEARTEPAGSSPLAKTISGRVYRLHPNQLKIDSFSFNFADDKSTHAFYDYDLNGEHFGGPIGLDGYYRVGGRRTYGRSVAKGRWLDDKTFQLELQTLGNDDEAIATVTFEGNSMSARLETLSGLKFDVKGEVAD